MFVIAIYIYPVAKLEIVYRRRHANFQCYVTK